VENPSGSVSGGFAAAMHTDALWTKSVPGRPVLVYHRVVLQKLDQYSFDLVPKRLFLDLDVCSSLNNRLLEPKLFFMIVNSIGDVAGLTHIVRPRGLVAAKQDLSEHRKPKPGER
jgi:hypothetical protein